MLTHYTVPVFNIPAGPKNLAVLFPEVHWPSVDEYEVEVLTDDDVILAKSNTYKTGCCCSSERVRIHFRNTLGCFDAINFDPPRIIHENKSDEYKKPLPISRVITDATTERFNIRSNETYEVSTACYHEEHMNWLKELADSGKAFMEWKGIQGQADSYLPIVIADSKTEVKKINDEWYYSMKLQFRLSNDNIIQR